MYNIPIYIKDAPSTGDIVEIKSPYNSEVVGKIEKANSEGLEQALKNSVQYFESEMKNMPAYKRAEILYKVSDMIQENIEEHAMLIAKEGGKPLTDARAEVIRAIDTVKMSGDEALNIHGEQIQMDKSKKGEPHMAFTIRQAIGPVLCISAFNHPLNLACHQIATAFAAGNTVIFKPASQTPLSGAKLIEYFYAAGAPAGTINLTYVSGREASTMVEDERIKFISFIGSAKVGWEMKKNMQPGVHIALEHGGTGTSIIDKDADINDVIPNLMKHAFYHAGQVCVSTQIVAVHEEIFDEVVQKIQIAASNLQAGDPSKEDTDLGPLIAPKELDRVCEWMDEAVNQGAKIVVGGQKVDETCMEATVLVDVKRGMKVMDKEVFGPILCVYKYSDLEHMIQEINAIPFSFQAAIYTQDIDKALYMAKTVEAKACMINQGTAFRVDWMPFGGSKHSGQGVGGMKYAIEELTEEKLIVMRMKHQ